MKLPRAHHLSDAEIAAQLLVVRADLPFLNRESSEARQLLRMQQSPVGGWQLTAGHPANLRFWTQRLAAESRIPQIFAGEIANGMADVLPQATRFPAFTELSLLDDPSLVAEAAGIIAREARSVGLNVLAGIPFPETDAKLISKKIVKTTQQFNIACFAKIAGNDSSGLSGEIGDAASAGFSGVVFDTQSFDAAISGVQSAKNIITMIDWQEENWQQSLVSGIALLRIATADFGDVHQQIHAAISTNSDLKSVACAAVDRLLRFKKWLHSIRPSQTHPMRPFREIAHPKHLKFAAFLAKRLTELAK